MLIAALLVILVVMSGLAAASVRILLQLVLVTGWFVPGRRMIRTILLRPRRDETSRAPAAQQPSIV